MYCKFIDIQAILAATDKIAVIHQAHIARIFRREVTWMSDLPKHANLGGSRGMLPRKFRCSEIASEAILGHRSRAVVAIWLAEYCFRLSMYAFTKPDDFEFSQQKVLRLAEQQMHHSKDLERLN